MNKKTKIKNNLQKYRVWKKLTQKEFAEEINVSTNLIRKIEINCHYPKYMIRARICNYFGINHNQMFFLEGDEI